MIGGDRLQMFGLIGLVSTGLAATINLLTFTLSANWLDITSLNHLRSALNTALIAGVLFCIGWDSACVRLRRAQVDQLEVLAFWGLHFSACVALLLGQIVGITAEPYVKGLALGALFAYPIMHFNIRRAKGHYFKYFIGLNIADKFVRAIVILAIVYNNPASIIELIFLFLLVWNISLKLSLSSQFSADYNLFLKFLKMPNKFGNGLFLLSSFCMFYLTRSLFFAIPSDYSTGRITVDLTMIVGAFLFVPVQSALKISEADQYRVGEPLFAKTPANTINKLLALEALIVIATSLLILGYSLFILPGQIIIPLVLIVLLGFIFLSTMPNMVQIAIHTKDKLWLRELIIFLALSLLAYLISPLLPYGVILAFASMAIGYLLFCARLAQRLGLSKLFQLRLLRTAFLIIMQIGLISWWI